MPLVRLELLFVTRSRHCSVAPRARQSELHRFLKHLKALHLVDGGLGRLGVVEDDEGLAFGLEVGLCHDVDDVAVLGEDGTQSLFQHIGLDAFFKVPHVDAIQEAEERLVTT